MLLTFNFPCASGAPAGAHSDEGNGERFGVGPGHEGDEFALAAGGHDAAVPAHPEPAELAAVQDLRCVNFYFVWFGSVPPDHAFGVAPTSDENLEFVLKS